MVSRARKKLVCGILAALLLALVLPPFINLNRYRVQVAGAISRALGRPATVGEVSLRLLPQPGFALVNLVVADDPSLSAEPVLRADEVTAALRLSSLWRGRLEIARLSLSNPSLNLVRGADGRWNLEPLLEHVSHTPTAPTAKPRPEARPRFPYIEADSGRINLKIGQEKKVYVLSDTDFALWLASENQWTLRLTAHPVRTDTSISDTGTIRVSGSVQRADRLADTSLNLRLALERGQLGQLSKLIYGRDRGWRGTVNVSATLKGTPAALRLTADASVDDFRRYDIYGGGSLRLVTRCSADYRAAGGSVSQLACESPVGTGLLSVKAELSGLLPPRSYKASIAAEDIPATRLAALARHMKQDLPQDLDADGSVNASFELRRDNEPPGRLWVGAGSTSQLRLRSRAMDVPLHLGDLRFTLVGPGTPPPQKSKGRHRPKPPFQPGDETALSLASFQVGLGGAAPATGQAWFSRTAYDLQVQGDARVERLLQVARALGLPTPAAAATGAARMNLQVVGKWTGFAPPVVTGSAQLRAVSAQLDALPSPLQIASADLTLDRSEVSVQKLVASFPAARLAFTATVHEPRLCSSPESCAAAFQVQAEQIDTDELNRLLNPRFRKRPWYALIAGPAPTGTPLSQINARGQLTAKRVVARSVPATHVSADLRLQDGILTLSNLQGDVLGGKYLGELRADFTGPAPVYAGQGTVLNLSLNTLAGIMRDNWAAGRATATWRGTASGWSAEELRDSAAGSLQLAWHNGTLTHVSLEGRNAPLRFQRFDAQFTLSDGVLALSPSKMVTGAGIYMVSGTASLERQLDLRLAGAGGRSYSLTGTLEKPRVAATSPPETRAALKP
jgi:uncharacterized protein involved in outer membrane biogenesis